MPIVLSEIIAMFLDVTGTDVSWADRITATSRLEADLHLDSLEFAALAAKVRAEYGGAVDLFAFVADLDIDQLIALTIEDVAGYVSRARG
jgi:acyl carrier protein